MSDAADDRRWLQAVNGQVVLARCLGVAAELGLADQLAAGPRTAAELAQAAGCDADALYRVLRLLASHHVFAADTAGRFALTPRAELLRRDRPDSLHSQFAGAWQDLAWATWAALPAAVRSGEVAFELAHGAPFFDYLAADAAAGRAFDRTMARSAAAENPVVAAHYDFGSCACVADIGGGRGGLLAAILARHPGVRGLLYDQPQVVAEPAELEGAGLLARCDVQAGDFFAAVPGGADLYVIKRILHDWPDADAVRILRRVHAAMRDGARVLVVDAVMQPGNAPDPNKLLDVTIMAMTRGRERTEAEFRQLFAAAGLQLERVQALPPPATLSLVLGRRAS